MAKTVSLEQSRIVEAPNRLKEDLGELTAEGQEMVVSILREFMADIRVIERLAKACPVRLLCEGKTKSRCNSCALEESTDAWGGFAPTAYGFLWAVYHSKFFICHANQRDWRDNVADLSRAELCSGFSLVLRTDPMGATLAAKVAMTRIRTAVSGFYMKEKEERVVVHILMSGRPLCGFSEEVPRDWPIGHALVGVEHFDQATCDGCRAQLEGIKRGDTKLGARS